jgi:glucose/arabinose dehydrogenase
MSVEATTKFAKPRRLLRRIFSALLAGAALVALTIGLLWIFGREPPSSKGDLVGAGVQLPSPSRSLVPTVNFSQAQPWPAAKQPIVPDGFQVSAYASGLDHPRWLYVLPNGDVLVAEASTVPRRDRSIAQAVQIWLQRDAGSVKDSANRITLLRDSGRPGTAAERFVFATNLNQPFGMVLLGDHFYVANTDGVWRFPYHGGDTHLEGPGEKVLDLPASGYNNHWTRNLIADRAGTKLYVTVGSGSNVGENGIDNEFHRANILQFNPDGLGLRVFASGLRNPNGLAFAPGTGRWSMSATCSATIWSPTISPASRMAASTAGRTAIGARMSTGA